MSENISKYVEQIVSKLTGNKDLISKFTSNPLSVVKDLLGIDLDKSQLATVVKGVTDKLGLDAGNLAKEGSGFLAKLKKFFGGK